MYKTNSEYRQAIREFCKMNCEPIGLDIDEESKDYLLLISNQSIRIIINYLEKIYILGEPVNLELCKKICSTISFQQFQNYIEKLRLGDLSGAILILYGIHDYGYSVIDILDYFFTFVKSTELLSEEDKYSVIPVLCKYITVFHNVHENCIELALFTNSVCKVIEHK